MTDNSPPNEEFDELVELLREAFATVEPTPVELVAHAEAAYEWRTVDAELAELVFDSAAAEPAGTRSVATDRRSFRFSAFDSTLRLFFTHESMVLTVEPAIATTCRVTTYTDSIELQTDDDGELIAAASELPVRIEIDLPEGTAVTPWIIG